MHLPATECVFSPHVDFFFNKKKKKGSRFPSQSFTDRNPSLPECRLQQQHLLFPGRLGSEVALLGRAGAASGRGLRWPAQLHCAAGNAALQPPDPSTQDDCRAVIGADSNLVQEVHARQNGPPPFFFLTHSIKPAYIPLLCQRMWCPMPISPGPPSRFCVFELRFHILTLAHEEEGFCLKASTPYSSSMLRDVGNECDRPFLRG